MLTTLGVARASATPRRARGFTLIDIVCTLAVLAILASLAYPSLAQQVRQSRRADAATVLTRVVHAQEQWRAQRPGYTRDLSSDGLGVSADADSIVSPDGHYRLSIAQSSQQRYEVHLSAIGAQAGDRACRHLRLVVAQGEWHRASGPDTRFDNPPGVNRQCWRH